MDKWELIKNLDLFAVRTRFIKKQSYLWRCINNAIKIEAQYRQFLFLAASNPSEVIVPWNQSLDDFWHEHILDTVKYAKDCEAIFGNIFHHNPHLPIGSSEQVKAYNKTKKVYKETFGEKAKSKNSHDPGCGGAFIPIFCGGDSHSSDSGHSDSGHSDSGHSDSGHSDSGHSDSGHSCSGHSCGGHSCGGSSCGSSCGGGGE